jgi:hypothetical protein
VPVLSEPITVVLPNVSTAGSRRMIALRRAMRRTPMASVIVTATGSPSGTADTANATATRNMSSADSPSATPLANATSAATATATPMTLANWSILRCNGVAATASDRINPAIAPSSVFEPVETTTPRPRPAVTVAPV